MKNKVLEHQYELGQVNYKILRKRFVDLRLNVSTSITASIEWMIILAHLQPYHLTTCV